MAFHEFAHVDADHVAFVVEEELGKRLAKFRLADAGRAQEHERADRPIAVLQARSVERRTALATASIASSWSIIRL